MPEIHATSILGGEIHLADDVSIGPNCVLDGPITIGAGTRLIGGVWLQGPIVMGSSNTIYPGATIGFAPQDLSWDIDRPGAGVSIGDKNVFREGATIHRATSDDAPTRMGDSNYWMVNSHAGHDCTIGNSCIFANGTLLGGHVHVGDRVVTGGNVAIHQFCQIGRGAMLGGGTIATRDVLPFFMLTGYNVVGSLNVVGLRRSGIPRDEIEVVRWVYKTLIRKGRSLQAGIAELAQRSDHPIVREYLDIINASKRGLCLGVADPRRGQISAIQD